MFLSQALRSWVGRVGHNLRIDYRWRPWETPKSTRVDAAELLRLAPDVILAVLQPGYWRPCRKRHTRPQSYLWRSVNQFAQGFVQSRAHPGGNITGFTNLEATFGGKWLGAAQGDRTARHARRDHVQSEHGPLMGVLFSPSVEAAAQKFAAKLTVATVHQLADVETVMSTLAREPGGGSIVLPDPFHSGAGQADRWAGRSLPTAGDLPFRFMLTDGGLASYGVNVPDLFRQAAEYTTAYSGRVKPSDLPVQQPTKSS